MLEKGLDDCIGIVEMFYCLLSRILPDICIKTYKEGESPKLQKQGRNYKEHKLRCTTYSSAGN